MKRGMAFGMVISIVAVLVLPLAGCVGPKTGPVLVAPPGDSPTPEPTPAPAPTPSPTPVPPAVITDNATSITIVSAALNGTLTSLGTATTVNVSFDWGLTDNYRAVTPLVFTNTTEPFSFDLSGLSPNTTYHFRAVAWGDGIGYGIDKTFTTQVLRRTAILGDVS